MSQHRIEEVLARINALSLQEQSQLRRRLKEQSSDPAPPVNMQQVAPPSSIKDLTRETAWLEQNRDKYAGQWVALDGDRLISSGSDATAVYAAAKAAGIADALLFKVEPRDALPFAGF